jgi:hypothetical protein
VEVGAGLAFVSAPSALFVILLGVPLDAPGGYAFRMFGVAIFAMGLGCWLARNDSGSSAARALTISLLFYDVAFISVLLVARFSTGLSGVGLWPVVVLHTALAVSSLLCLRPEAAIRAAR